MKILIVGYKRSGKSAAKLLAEHKNDICIYDDNITSIEINEINRNKWEIYDENKSNIFDRIIVSPSVPLTHEICVKFRKLGVKIIGELEQSYIYNKGINLAVTGTNGKSTTVSLIHHICSQVGTSFLVGNIGTPLSEKVMNIAKDDFVVTEVSSFQLESIELYKPYIASILNITPDHLNRHMTMNEYIRCKYLITQNQDENDFLILNADDDTVMNCAEQSKAQIYYLSLAKPVVGCYCSNDILYYNDGFVVRQIVDVKDIKLLGKHNILNTMCAIVYAKLLKIDENVIKNAIKSFLPVRHRLQLVGSKNGVDFINDSKATNIDSSLVAIKCFSQPICLIVGGSDKGYEFDDLIANLPSNLVRLLIIGETKNKIVRACIRHRIYNYTCLNTLESAIRQGYELLYQCGGVLMLSPACASFDMFVDYEHRGNCFIRIAEGIINED